MFELSFSEIYSNRSGKSKTYFIALKAFKIVLNQQIIKFLPPNSDSS